MHSKFKIMLIVFFWTASFSLSAQTLDLQCEYEFSRTDSFNAFVKKETATSPYNTEFYRKYEWWEYWQKRIINFSINLKTNGVTGGFNDKGFGFFPNSTKADIYPDEIVIEQNLVLPNHENHEHNVNTFYISRLDGHFSGTHNEFAENTEKMIVQYNMYGKCKLIERLF